MELTSRSSAILRQGGELFFRHAEGHRVPSWALPNCFRTKARKTRVFAG
jgi:hypothetical protein